MKVIGLTGTVSCGKETIVEILKRKFSAYHVRLSDIIRTEMEKKKHNFNRMTLQDMGNEMRKKYGTHILAMLAIEYLNKDKKIIIDGIRNPGEVEYLRKKYGKDFVLIAVDAPQQLRFERMLKRTKKTDPKTFDEFVVLDRRDQGEGEPEHGQQTKRCIEKADFVIVNDGSVEQLEAKVNEIIGKL